MSAADEQAEILARVIAEEIRDNPDGALARRLRETRDTVAAFAAFWERLPEDVKERARAESERGKVEA